MHRIENGKPYPQQLDVREAAFVAFADTVIAITHNDRLRKTELASRSGPVTIAAKRARSGMVWIAISYADATFDAPVIPMDAGSKSRLRAWGNSLHLVTTSGIVHEVKKQRLIGLPHDLAHLIRSAADYEAPYVRVVADIQAFQKTHYPLDIIRKADAKHTSIP